MFNLDYRLRSDRIKLFLIIFGLCSLVSLLVVFLSGGFQEPPANKEQQVEVEIPAAASGNIVSSRSSEASKPLQKRSEIKTILPSSVLHETKQTAQNFAKAYYTYDPKHPEQYVENSKPFMTEKLYVYEKTKIRKQTLDRETTRAIRATILPVDSYDSSELVWCVVLEGEVTPATGKKYPENLQYFVTLRETDDAWKVADFSIEEGGE
ncbi:hypothetical protein ACTHSJ_32615 [Paenibacillus cellulositrophicus]|uniref:hypothetical protein n=1 Tax=Paenibacillus cellulositrophicus TaxID=562959 RepID=UPI003F7D8094